MVRIEPAARDRIEQVLQVIEAANPHLSLRFQRFRASGAFWHNAVPMLCEVDGISASAAVIFKRAIHTPSGPVLFGGIGAVATIPEMRRKGLAATLLRECEQLLQSEGYELGILFSSLSSFYEQLGWKAVKGGQPRNQVAALPTAPPRLTFRPIDLNSLPEEIAALYDRSGTGAMVRDPGVWGEYASWLREDQDLFWAAFDADCLLGYSRARRRGDAIEIVEATIGDSHQDVVPALIRKQLTIASVPKCLPCTSTMMIKPLFPKTRGGGPMLTATDFENGVPWRPRTWWPVDRF